MRHCCLFCVPSENLEQGKQNTDQEIKSKREHNRTLGKLAFLVAAGGDGALSKSL